VAQAQARLQASRQTLQLVVSAATTPKLASTVNLTGLTALTAQTSGTGAPSTTAAASGTRPPTTVSLTTLASVGAENGPGGASPASPTILGQPVLDGPELAAWFVSTKHKAHITVTVQQLAADYQAAGQATGVRDDLAFAQSVVETGYFSFPSYGQLTPKDNNFAGIGACDSCAHGWSFRNAQTGVGAQMELLEAYASAKKVPTPLIGPVGVGGCCTTWMALAGTWASSLSYGISILTIYNQMLTWLIPQRLLQVGILPPGRAAGPAGKPGAPATSTAATATTPATSPPTTKPIAPAPAASRSGSGSTSVIAAHYR
jgi:Mannosyl-glycoprotein endo-beta-N-acetylglucosaminidase